MNNKENIILHINGVDAFKRNDFSLATSTFQKIDSPSSYIIYNIGCCHLNEKNYEFAENCFYECIQKDKYNSAGFFQLAAVQCLIRKFSNAGDNFKKCLEAFRGNDFIDYKQLNMKARLYAWQVQFNLGLLYMFSGDHNRAFSYFREAGCLYRGSGINNPISFALKAFQIEDFSYFGDSIAHRLITLPKTAIFAPSKAKREGVESDSLMKTSVSQVVSAVNDDYDFIGFVGPEKLKRQMVDKNENKSNKPEISFKKSEDNNSLAPPSKFPSKVSAFKPLQNVSRPSSPRNLPLPPAPSVSRSSSQMLPPLPPKTLSKASSTTNLSTLPSSTKPKSRSSSPIPSSHQLIPTSRPYSASFSASLPPPPSHAPPHKPKDPNDPPQSDPKLTLFTEHPYLKPKVIKTNQEMKSIPILLQFSLNFSENQITSYENFIKALYTQLQTTTLKLMNGDNLNMQLNSLTSGLNSKSWNKNLILTEQINILHLKPN